MCAQSDSKHVPTLCCGDYEIVIPIIGNLRQGHFLELKIKSFESQVRTLAYGHFGWIIPEVKIILIRQEDATLEGIFIVGIAHSV
jgi:hypothetical protein